MSAKPRILYAITDLLTGGVPLHLHKLCVHFMSRDYDVSVFCLAPPGPVSEQLSHSGIRVTHGHAHSAAQLGVIKRLASSIREERPDVVHAFLFHANLAARLAGWLAGFDRYRLICEIQTVEIERPWHLWLDGLTQELCGFEVGNSPSVVEHLAERAHIRREKLVLNRGGIDPSASDRAAHRPRRHWNLPEGIPLAVWVGRLDPVKGLDTLIEAAAAVVVQQPMHLALVGAGEFEPQVRAAVQRFGISDHVSFLGRRDDVIALLKVADLFVFPSLTEGLPNAVLEAMSAALPIVTTDVPGCRDLIQHEQNGLLVPSSDVAALTQAMLRVLQSKDFASTLGRRARQNLEAQWNIEFTYRGYEELYARVISASDSPLPKGG